MCYWTVCRGHTPIAADLKVGTDGGLREVAWGSGQRLVC